MTRPLAFALAALLLVASQPPLVSRAAANACTHAEVAPLAARTFAFPRDDGAHAGFTSEWWRTFGRVSDASGRRYDFSVNVSRFALRDCAGDSGPAAAGRWTSRAIVTTTYELLDESALVVERGTNVERESPLGARAGSRDLTLATQTVRYAAAGAASRRNRTFELALADRGNAVSLAQTVPQAALALGPRGVMPTGTCATCDAYAYAYPRLVTRGSLRIRGIEHRVSGSTWMEHEFAHRELASSDAGWNRYELQFDDGRDLDARFTRDLAGNVVALSGVFVSASGTVTYLHDGDARVSDVLHTVWRSSPSGVTYPSLWALDVGFAHLGLATVEVALDQEARDPQRTPYFSGAVVVERVGPPEGDRGHGFVELTGYGSPVSL